MKASCHGAFASDLGLPPPPSFITINLYVVSWHRFFFLLRILRTFTLRTFEESGFLGARKRRDRASAPHFFSHILSFVSVCFMPFLPFFLSRPPHLHPFAIVPAPLSKDCFRCAGNDGNSPNCVPVMVTSCLSTFLSGLLAYYYRFFLGCHSFSFRAGTGVRSTLSYQKREVFASSVSRATLLTYDKLQTRDIDHWKGLNESLIY
jgi:hypothetical protein